MALFTGGKKVEKLTQDNERLTKEVAKLKQLHDKMNRENGDLRMEKSNLLIDIDTLRSQLNTFMEKYVDVEELEKRAEELRGQISGFESAPAASEQISIAYEDIPAHLRSEIEELEERKTALERDIKTKEAYLEKLKAQFDLLEQAALNQAPPSFASDAGTSQLTAEQESLQEIILELRRQKSELEEEISALRAERSAPAEMPHFDPFASFGQPATLAPVDDEELNRLRAQLTEKEEELYSLQQRLNEELADKNLEISSLRSQLDDKDRRISALGLDGVSISSEPKTEPLPSWLTGEEQPATIVDTVIETPELIATGSSADMDDLLAQKDMQIENLQETIATLNFEIENLRDQIAGIQENAAQAATVDAEPEVESFASVEIPAESEVSFVPGPEAETPEIPDIATAAGFMEQFEAEIANLQQLAAEHENLKAEKEGLLMRLEESENTLLEVNKQLDEVLLENERLNNEVDALLEELEAMKAAADQTPQVDQVVTTPEVFEEKEQSLTEHLMKKEQLSGEVISLRKEIDRLSSLAKEQAEGLVQANEEFAAIDAKRSEVLLNIQQLEEKRALLTKDLATLEESRNALELNVNGLTGTVNDLEVTSKVLEEKQLKTEELVLEALKSFNQEVGSLREQQSKIRADILEKEKSRSIKESEISKLDLELSELRSEIKIAEKDLVNIRQHIQNLKDEKDTLNRNLFEMKDTEKRVNLIVQELKKNRDSLKEENDELERKLSSMFNNFTKRHNELESRRSELEGIIKTRQNELSVIQENIETSGLMLDRVKAELHSLELQKSEIVNGIERLKKIEKDAHDSTSEI